MGTLLALRATDGRVAAFGLALVLVLAPAVSSPLPGVVPLAFRVLAALLAAYLVYLSLRTTTRLIGASRLGGTPEALFVLLGFILGGLLTLPSPQTRGDTALLAATLAAGIGAVTLLPFSRDPIRLGVGAMLGLVAAGLGAAWLSGTAGELAQLSLGSAILAAGAATAWLSVLTFKVHGDLDLAGRPRDPRERG